MKRISHVGKANAINGYAPHKSDSHRKINFGEGVRTLKGLKGLNPALDAWRMPILTYRLCALGAVSQCDGTNRGGTCNQDPTILLPCQKAE